MSERLNGVHPGMGVQPVSESASIEELRDQLAEAHERLRELEHRAGIDTVTDLPRRSVMLAMMNAQIRHRRNFAIVFLDLDNFKRCNDLHGHDVGDELLRRTSMVLTANIREADGDMAARWGGDEFVVLLRSGEDAEYVGARLCGEVARALDKFGAGCSFGVSNHPEDGTVADELLRAADLRMLIDKRERKR